MTFDLSFKLQFEILLWMHLTNSDLKKYISKRDKVFWRKINEFLYIINVEIRPVQRATVSNVTLDKLEKGLFNLDISNFYIVFLQSILIANQ